MIIDIKALRDYMRDYYGAAIFVGMSDDKLENKSFNIFASESLKN